MQIMATALTEPDRQLHHFVFFSSTLRHDIWQIHQNLQIHTGSEKEDYAASTTIGGPLRRNRGYNMANIPRALWKLQEVAQCHE
jgi:hypothetical protein